MSTLESFMPPAADSEAEQPKKKKQKVTKSTQDDAEFVAMRTRARVLCTCPEQWRLVSKYKKSRIGEFIQEQEFLQQKAAEESISTGAASIFTHGLDWVLGGGKGYIKEELMSSAGWRASFDEEVGGFAALLNNKCRLAVLTSSGVMNGKQAQWALEPATPPETVPIIEQDLVEEQNEQLVVPEPHVEYPTEEQEVVVDVVPAPEETPASWDSDHEASRDSFVREKGEWQDMPARGPAEE